MISYEDVQSAAERIKPFINTTPVLTCSTLSDMYSEAVDKQSNKGNVVKDDANGLARKRSLYFKCENMQKVNHFQSRFLSKLILLILPSQIFRYIYAHQKNPF
jgi:threonine dehydratase